MARSLCRLKLEPIIIIIEIFLYEFFRNTKQFISIYLETKENHYTSEKLGLIVIIRKVYKC
jgi:hypothetical protein